MNQRERVLQYIKDFGSISDYEAVVELGILQFGARIFELKQQGYHFSTEWVSTKNRYGDKVTFKKYRLEEAND